MRQAGHKPGGKKEDMKMQVVKNGEKIEMTYDEVCYDLGFCLAVRFVDITPRVEVTFTTGRPEEARALYQAVKDRGYNLA